MAKTRNRPGLVEDAEATFSGHDASIEADILAATERCAETQGAIAGAVAAPSRYRVGLVCPTPLLHRELVVEAANETDAKAKFCEANGISDSVHPWTIERSP